MPRPRARLLSGLLYVLALVGAIVGVMTERHMLEYVCRPVMMVVLSLWFFRNSRRVGDRFTLLVQAGLFFSLVADVGFMVSHLDEFNFVIGLGALFVAQLCYTVAFADNVIQVGGFEGLLLSLVMSVLIAAFVWFFTWDLLPMVDFDMRMPVVGYAVITALMGVMASFRYLRTFQNSFLLVLFGVRLLIGAESVLAVNRFRRPFDLAPLIILLSYAAGQWMIAAGSLTHVLDPDNLLRRRAMDT